MFNVLKLLIPALLPSWNFFDYITPSPRIQFTLLKHENAFFIPISISTNFAKLIYPFF